MADDYAIARRGSNPWQDQRRGPSKREDNREARHRMKEQTRDRVRQADIADDNEPDTS